MEAMTQEKDTRKGQVKKTREKDRIKRHEKRTREKDTMIVPHKVISRHYRRNTKTTQNSVVMKGDFL